MATLVAVATVMVVTLLIGLHGVAAMRTTSDFLVASRRVSPLLNSAAVSGEYLSAASFLGVAGLVVRDGVGALWYPVGFTAGYIAMLILVAAPMRRSGALTVPDFAEARLASPGLRRLSAVVVLVIGALYLVPQLRTAGLVLSVVSDLPYWVGVVIAGVVVSATLALGGMRAATYVQAFQFLVKLLLFIVPALWLLVIVGPHVRHEAVHPVEFTHFPKDTAVEFQVDATLTFPEPVTVRTPDGTETVLGPGEVRVDANQTLVFPKDTPVPTVNGGGIPGGEQWHRPLLNLSDYGHPLLATLAVLTATALGTMGLPHVLMRFHTSPDGRSARRTAAFTVALLGIFYLFPGIYGALGRVLVPELYLSGVTDTVVVALPSRVSDDCRHPHDHPPVGGRVRRVPRHLGGLAARHLRGDLLRPAARRTAPPADHRAARRSRHGAPRAPRRTSRRGHARHLGVYRGRVHVLPPARPGDLVAAVDESGSRQRRPRRPVQYPRCDRSGPVRPPARRLAGDPHHPARAVDRAARLRHHGGGLPARPSSPVVAHRDAPPPPGRTAPRHPLGR